MQATSEFKVLAIADEVLEVIDKYDDLTHDDILTIIEMIQEHTQVGTYGSPFNSGKIINNIKKES